MNKRSEFRDFIVGDRVKFVDKGDIGTINHFLFEEYMSNHYYINGVNTNYIVISIFKEISDNNFSKKVVAPQIEIYNDFSDLTVNDRVLLSNGKTYKVIGIDDSAKIFSTSNGLEFNISDGGNILDSPFRQHVFTVRKTEE